MGDADINIDEMITRLLEIRNKRHGKGKFFKIDLFSNRQFQGVGSGEKLKE